MMVLLFFMENKAVKGCAIQYGWGKTFRTAAICPRTRIAAEIDYFLRIGPDEI
jgi:hypothetical protein